MRILTKVEGRVTGPGRDDYFYTYSCLEVDQAYTVIHEYDYEYLYKSSLGDYPYSVYFNYANNVDIDELPTEEYLSALAEYLNENYQKKIPKRNATLDKFDDSIFREIDAHVKENLYSSSYTI